MINLDLIVQKPNLIHSSEFEIGQTAEITSIDNKKREPVEIISNAIYDKRFFGAALLFRRKQNLFDYIAVDTKKNNLPIFFNKETLIHIEKIMWLIAQKKLNIARTIAKKNIFMLRDFNFSKKYIEQILDPFDDKIKQKLLALI